MKKLSLILLLLALVLATAIACQESDDPKDTADSVTTDTVTTDGAAETTKEPETEPPVTLAGSDGAPVTDEALHGWFDYGSALYHRDKFRLGTKESIAISMAKNEKEGFEYLLASTVDYSGLRCEVSTLTDGNGNTLEGVVYIANNIYVKKSAGDHLRGYTPDPLLEQDNPYHGGTFDVRAGRSKTLYVQYVTTKDTVPGTYTGRLEIKKGEDVLLEGDVSVTVWDIYYDEKTECLNLFQYGYDPNDEGAGVGGPSGAPDFTGNWALSEQYVDFMIDNRLSPWHFPFEGGVLNEKAEKYLNDPRVTLTYITDLPNPSLQYERAEEMGWLDKLVVLTYDEPHSEEQMGKLENGVNMFNRTFPTTMHLNPFGEPKMGDLHMDWIERITALSTIHCPNTLYFKDDRSDVRDFLMSLKYDKGDTVLWYVCGIEEPDLINFLTATPGTEKRVLFWQQYQNDVDGFLYFQTTKWNRYDDFWAEDYDDKKLKLPSSMEGPTGDGVMIYFDPITQGPVGSLTMEAARDGIEDFQLMRMAEGVLGKEAVMAYVEQITTSVTEYTTDAELLAQARNELAEALLAATAH